MFNTKNMDNITPGGNTPEKTKDSGKSPYLTAQQAAEYLNVSRRTIQRIVDAGKCRAYQDGRILRFRTEDLDRYMEAYSLRHGLLRENKLRTKN